MIGGDFLIFSVFYGPKHRALINEITFEPCYYSLFEPYYKE